MGIDISSNIIRGSGRLIYIYSILLLLVFLILVQGVRLSLKAPIKLKVLSLIAILAMICRYISILLVFFIYNIRKLYLLKPVIFLNLLSVPIIAIICLYIIWRNEKIKFIYLFIIAGILAGLYVVMQLYSSTYITIINNYFYDIQINESLYVDMVYVGLNLMFLVFAMYLTKNKWCDKFAVTAMVLAVLITSAEIIGRKFGIIFLPNGIVGDIFWLITLDYCLSSLSSIKR